MLRDLGHLEVGLRNAYDAAVGNRRHGDRHWLIDPTSPLRLPLMRTRRVAGQRQRIDINRKPRAVLDTALAKVGLDAPPGKVIAELPFGFWRYCTSTSHEKTLWVPFLRHAFARGTDRRRVDRSLGRLNQLRNRIAHHEPLFQEPLAECHGELIALCDLFNAQLGQYLRATTSVPMTLKERPL